MSVDSHMTNFSLSDGDSRRHGAGGGVGEFFWKLKSLIALRSRGMTGKLSWIRERIEERPLYAVGLFVVAFAFPVLLVWSLSSPKSTTAAYFAALEQSSRKLETSGSRLTFAGSGPIHAPEGKDLLVYSTWKVRNLPAPGEKTVLLSKTSLSARGDGFALGLINDSGSLRFMLSWPGPDGARWMRFGEVLVTPDQWFMIALSVRNRQAVGAFFVPLTGKRERARVQTLGGFNVAGLPAASQEPLSLALQGSGRYMSRVGPVGILRGAGLGGREAEILREVASDPMSPPASVKENQVALFWAGGPKAIGNDLGIEYPVL